MFAGQSQVRRLDLIRQRGDLAQLSVTHPVWSMVEQLISPKANYYQSEAQLYFLEKDLSG
jgi:hypothetical protein